MVGFSESIVEDAALAWLETLDYAVLHGPTSPLQSLLPSAALEQAEVLCNEVL